MESLIGNSKLLTQTDYYVITSSDNQKIEVHDFQEIDHEMKEKVCIPYFKKLFEDLSIKDKMGKKGISRPTFINFLNLPGLIGERFFNLFDKRKINLIDLNDFVVNMLKLFSTDFNVRMKLVFKMYDFDNDGLISKEDVKALLIHIPRKLFSNKGVMEGKCTDKVESNQETDILQDEKELEVLTNSFFQNSEQVNFIDYVEICEKECSDVFFAIYSLLKDKCPGIKQFKNYETILFKDSTGIYQPNILKSPSLKKLASPKCPSRFSPLSLIVKTSPLDPSSKTQNKAIQFLSQFGPLKDSKSKRKELRQTSTYNYTMNASRMCNKIISEFNVTMSPTLMFREDDKERLYCKCGREILDLNLMMCNECISREKEGKIDGILCKIKKDGEAVMKKYTLEGKELFCYSNSNPHKPKDVHPLYDCYYDDIPEKEINNEKIFFFQIRWKNKIRILGSSNVELYGKWSSAIKKAVGYSNINEYYEFNKNIGEGKFGIVKLAFHKKTGKKVAIKIMKKSGMKEMEVELMMREIENLKLCRHRNIIKLYDVFENDQIVYLVMEYLEGGDLFSYLEKRDFRITENRAKSIVCSLISAINYLNSFGIVHRDLKPENILLLTSADNSDIKIADFGLAKTVGPNEKCTEPFGTINYVAPEILMRKKYDKGVDIWSLGMITYLMLGGYLAFDDYNDSEIVKKICTQEVSFNNVRWEMVSEEAKDFIKKCLTKDMAKRSTLKDLITHKWVAFVDNFQKEFKDLITEQIKNPELNAKVEIENLHIKDII